MDARFCPNCGAQNPGGAKFCPSCGAPFEMASSAPAQPPSAQPGGYYGQPPYGQTPAAYGQRQPYIHPQISYAQPAASYGARPRGGISKRAKIIIGAAAAAVTAGVLIAVLATRGGSDGNYLTVGGERIPSVSYALGERRKVQSIGESTKSGIDILRVDYAARGHGADVTNYLAYLCGRDGFAMRDGDDVIDSGEQVWRNSTQTGYMLVVQVDFDANGYTVTAMRGKGQVSGGTPTGESSTPSAPAASSEETVSSAPASSESASGGDYSRLLPDGEPTDTLSLNGYEIAGYDDGTVSVNGGKAIIMPDGAVYVNCAKYESKGKMTVPDGGTSATVGDAMASMADGKLYVAANGSILFVDEEGNAAAYTIQ